MRSALGFDPAAGLTTTLAQVPLTRIPSPFQRTFSRLACIFPDKRSEAARFASQRARSPQDSPAVRQETAIAARIRKAYAGCSTASTSSLKKSVIGTAHFSGACLSGVAASWRMLTRPASAGTCSCSTS